MRLDGAGCQPAVDMMVRLMAQSVWVLNVTGGGEGTG